MKLFKMFFRNEEAMSVDVVETWEVRWESRYDDYVYGVKPEIRVFPSKQDAQAFAKALRDAFALIKHTSGHHVSVTKG